MKKACAYFAVAMLLTAIFVSDSVSQTRIRFVRGRTSASVSGYLAGNEIRKFLLSARGGQTLSANVSSGNGCVKFLGGDDSTTASFTTIRGDNEVGIINDCRRRTNYTLTVSIY